MKSRPPWRPNETMTPPTRAAIIEWRDIMEVLAMTTRRNGDAAVATTLQEARLCQHPDAQWLASLFPEGSTYSCQSFYELLMAHDNDPRALYLAACVEFDKAKRHALTERASDLGYAPAQVFVGCLKSRPELIRKAAEQGGRVGSLLSQV
jgi:hypothetical protein